MMECMLSVNTRYAEILNIKALDFFLVYYKYVLLQNLSQWPYGNKVPG